jgi:SnoaL-like protein
MTQGSSEGRAGTAEAVDGVELARRFIEAFDARDVEGLRALIGEDTEFRNRNGKSFRGHDGVRDLVRAAEDADLFLSRSIGEPRVEDGGARVLMPIRILVGRDDMGATAAFEIRDGRIAAFEVIRED